MGFENRPLEENEKKEYEITFPDEMKGEKIIFSGGTINTTDDVKLFCYANKSVGKVNRPDDWRLGIHYFLFDYKGKVIFIRLRRRYTSMGDVIWRFANIEEGKKLEKEEIESLKRAMKVYACKGYNRVDWNAKMKDTSYVSINEKTAIYVDFFGDMKEKIEEKNIVGFVNRPLEEDEEREYELNYPFKQGEKIVFSGGTINTKENVRLFCYADEYTGQTDKPRIEIGTNYFIYDYKGKVYELELVRTFSSERCIHWKNLFIERKIELGEDELKYLREAIKIYAYQGYDNHEWRRKKINPSYIPYNEMVEVKIEF